MLSHLYQKSKRHLTISLKSFLLKTQKKTKWYGQIKKSCTNAENLRSSAQYRREDEYTSSQQLWRTKICKNSISRHNIIDFLLIRTYRWLSSWQKLIHRRHLGRKLLRRRFRRRFQFVHRPPLPLFRLRFLDHLIPAVLIQIDQEFAVGEVGLVHTAPISRRWFLQG